MNLVSCLYLFYLVGCMIMGWIDEIWLGNSTTKKKEKQIHMCPDWRQGQINMKMEIIVVVVLGLFWLLLSASY